MTRWLAVVLLAGCGGGSEATVDGPPSHFAPQLSVDPQNAALGTSPIGVLRGGTHITVTNIGAAPTGPITPTLTGTDFSLVHNGCTTLDVLATCDLELGVTPSVVGAITGALSVTADPGGIATTTLAATGAPKNDLAVQARVDFGGQAVGVSSAPLMVAVTNTGTTATGALTIALQTGSRFTITADGCTGQTVAPAAMCGVTMTYTADALTPLGSGGDLDTLTISGDPGGTVATTLAGFGISLSIGPNDFVFPGTAVGASSAPQVFTVTNVSAGAIGPLTTALGVAGYAITADTCATATLVPTDHCAVTVAFTPSASGTVVSSVAVADASQTNYTRVQLVGTAP